MKKGILTLLCAGLFLFFASPKYVFGYGIETHAGLTKETIKFYKTHFIDNPIPDHLKDYLMDASRREDDPPRWMNHFYDPVYNRGLESNIYGNGIASKVWAQSDEEQVKIKYDPFVASILSSVQQRKIQKYFPASNFSWNEAIRYWLNGDKEMAMFSLGHVLHLIQDASVPDHTRNDPHPPIEGGSPYEDWADQFHDENIDLSDLLKDKEMMSFGTLDEYFDSIASYSNKNFYTDDTIGIQSGYNSPTPVDYEKRGVFIFSIGEDNGERFILLKQPSVTSVLAANRQEYIFDDAEVLGAYWSRLSVKAVQYGAGVIDLFFKEVERAKSDPNFSRTNKTSAMGIAVSRIKSVASAAVSAVGGFFGRIGEAAKDLFNGNSADITIIENDARGSRSADPRSVNIVASPLGVARDTSEDRSVSVRQKNELRRDNNGEASQSVPLFQDGNDAGSFIKDAENADIGARDEDGFSLLAEISLSEDARIPPPEDGLFLEGSGDDGAAAACSFSTSQTVPADPLVVINEIAWMGTLQSASDEWIEIMNRSGEMIDIAGWQLVDRGEQIRVVFSRNTILTPMQPFYLLERTDDDTVPGVAASQIYKGALGNTDEALRLFDAGCNLVDEVFASPKWSAGDEKNRLTMERTRNSLLWQTYYDVGGNDSDILGTPKALNSMPPFTGGGGAGPPVNLPTSSAPPPAPPAPPPLPAIQESSTAMGSSSSPSPSEGGEGRGAGHIVISEIFIDRTGGNQDFIELYNPTDQVIDISSWSVQILSGNATALDSIKKKNFESGDVIGPRGFFLIGLDQYPSGDSTSSPAASSGQIAAADMAWRSGSLNNTGATVFLVSETAALLNAAERSIVDMVAYGTGSGLYPSETAPAPLGVLGESIERKAIYGGLCGAPDGAGEFLGNGCDTNNNADDFFVRAAPKPQNTASLSEPRSAPASVENLSVAFNKNSMMLFLDWGGGESGSGGMYNVYSVNSPETFLATASTSEYQYGVGEVGREYVFRVSAVDADGLESEKSEVTATPKFIEDAFFYMYHDQIREGPVLDIRFSEYPFIPQRYGRDDTWTLFVAYLNQDPYPEVWLDTSMAWEPSDTTGVLAVGYPRCGVQDERAFDFSKIIHRSVILPDSGDRCTSQIAAGSEAMRTGGEDNRLLFTTAHPDGEKFSEADFITFAYYALIHSGGGSHAFQLVATDARRYYFKNQGPENLPPSVPPNFSIEVDSIYRLRMAWDPASDPDGFDDELVYEGNVSVGGALDETQWGAPVPELRPGEVYTVGMRARDTFGAYSPVATTSLVVAHQPSPFGLTDIRWGRLDPEQPEKVFLSFNFPGYPIIGSDPNIGWFGITMMVAYLNQMPPADYEQTARGEHISSLRLGESYPRLLFSYMRCGGEGPVAAMVFQENIDCQGRGDSIHHREIEMPTGDGPGNITVEVSGLKDVERAISALTQDDYITFAAFSATNDGVPRGTFRPAGIDRNRYYFEE